MKYKKNSKSKNDLFLGMGLLLAALCLWLIMGLLGNSGAGTVEITVDGNFYGTYSLTEEQSIMVMEHNKIVIEAGSVWMEEADCPDRRCIHQGKISKAGQTIICLPNKVMITITGQQEVYDGIAQ